MLNATPLLRLYAWKRLRTLNEQNPAAAQRATLTSLLRTAAGTRFGKDHGFESIGSVEEYQRRVPLRRYEDFWKQYFEASFPRLENCTWPGLISYFAVSSGTSTGPTKYIPFTKEMERSNTKAGIDVLCHHLANKPESQIFGGKSFVLGGSTDLVEQAPGIFSGDLSGIAVKTLPWWAQQRYFPPPKLALLKNWEEKIDVLARESLQQDIRSLSGVPSWLLILIEKLKQLRPKSGGRLAALYPNLELLIHGGVSFAPYKPQFEDLLRGSRAEMREVYPASEGFIASADRGYGDGMRLMLDSGIFFEFVPLEELNSDKPTRHWVDNIELGVNYAVVMTTCAGLWSYIIGDTVKFVDRRPPRVLVSGRVSYYLSAFGEHLLGEEIEDAVSFAAQSIGTSVTDYSVGAVFPQNTADLGGHLFIVEPTSTVSAEKAAQFSEIVDKRLRERNEDYDAHRANGYGLRSPRVTFVPTGTFAGWMKSRGKLGGQNKVPRIINDRDLFQSLQDFTAAS